MDDADLVRATRSGDLAAFAEIFDRHAGAVHDLALAMLRDRSLALEVVEATFLEASLRLQGLHEEHRLPVWLLALTRRNGALRAGPTAGIDRQPALPNDDPQRFHLAGLVWEAVADLPLRDRTLFDLELRHGLMGLDLADALGVSPSQAQDLQGRMRDRIEKSLSAYLVARTTGGRCVGLAKVLKGWDSRFAPKTSRRITDHVTRCPACTQARFALPSPFPLYAAALPAPFPAAVRSLVLDRVVLPVAGHPAPGATYTPAGAGYQGDQSAFQAPQPDAGSYAVDPFFAQQPAAGYPADPSYAQQPDGTYPADPYYPQQPDGTYPADPYYAQQPDGTYPADPYYAQQPDGSYAADPYYGQQPDGTYPADPYYPQQPDGSYPTDPYHPQADAGGYPPGAYPLLAPEPEPSSVPAWYPAPLPETPSYTPTSYPAPAPDVEVPASAEAEAPSYPAPAYAEPTYPAPPPDGQGYPAPVYPDPEPQPGYPAPVYSEPQPDAAPYPAPDEADRQPQPDAAPYPAPFDADAAAHPEAPGAAAPPVPDPRPAAHPYGAPPPGAPATDPEPTAGPTEAPPPSQEAP